MTFSMHSLLPALSPHSAELVGPASLERIERLTRGFPAIGSNGAFELHLGTGADRADLLVFSDGQGGRRKLSRALAQGEPVLKGPALRPLLEEWTLPGALLSEKTSLIWLEYDLPGGEGSRPPMVYFGLLGMSPAELGSLVQRTRQILTGRAAEDAQIRTLDLCARSLPDDGQITFVADPCRSRDVEYVRVIAQMPRVHAWSWLERIGWPGSRDQWEHASSLFTTCPAQISLYINVAATVGPTLGIESTLPPPDSDREVWEGLAEGLVDLGATTTEEFDEVLDWTGSETVELADHESLVRLERVPGFKLVVDARGSISAKAYLAFRARETLF